MRAYTRRRDGKAEADAYPSCEVCGNPGKRPDSRFCSIKCSNAHFNNGGKANKVVGWIYILTHPSWPSRSKIGKTNDLARRLSTYNTGCPDRLYTYQHAIKVEDMHVAERIAHRQLRGLHRSGEWFSIHADDAYTILDRVLAARGLRLEPDAEK